MDGSMDQARLHFPIKYWEQNLVKQSGDVWSLFWMKFSQKGDWIESEYQGVILVLVQLWANFDQFWKDSSPSKIPSSFFKLFLFNPARPCSCSAVIQDPLQAKYIQQLTTSAPVTAIILLPHASLWPYNSPSYKYLEDRDLSYTYFK